MHQRTAANEMLERTRWSRAINTAPVESKADQRAELDRQIAEFHARGKSIEKIPTGVTRHAEQVAEYNGRLIAKNISRARSPGRPKKSS